MSNSATGNEIPTPGDSQEKPAQAPARTKKKRGPRKPVYFDHRIKKWIMNLKDAKGNRVRKVGGRTRQEAETKRVKEIDRIRQRRLGGGHIRVILARRCVQDTPYLRHA